MKVEKVIIKNYRNFVNESVQLSNFNVLIGQNGTGKSNFMNAISLGLRAVDMSGNPFRGELDQNDPSYHVDIRILARLTREELSDDKFSSDENKLHYRFIYIPANDQTPFMQISPSRTTKSGSSIGSIIINNRQIHISKDIKTDVLNNENIFVLQDSREIQDKFAPNGIKNPRQFSFENALLLMKLNNEEKFKQLIESFQEIMPEVKNIFFDLDQNSARIEMEEKNLHKRIWSSLISRGLRELLMILITLEFCPDNSLLLIEEPEVHLHGSAIRNLKNIMLRTSKEKKLQIIVATHSCIFLEGIYPSEDTHVKILNFIRDEGKTIIKDLKEEKEISEIPVKMGCE